MFTVVISEKENLNSIQEYNVFLKPLIDTKDLAFCEWNPCGQTLEEMVPDLETTVSRHSQWRAVVLCDDRGQDKLNPFDLVECVVPTQALVDEDPFSFSDRVFAVKKQAYDEAAQMPLTRLATFLCPWPEISPGRNRIADKAEQSRNTEAFLETVSAESDDWNEELVGSELRDRENNAQFAEYQREAQYKQELRRKIIGDRKLDIVLPDMFYCVAKRTYQNGEQTLNSVWTPHLEIQYSRFYDWNLYFDKMRYLVFDIVSSDHQNYSYDYMRYLYAVLLLAQNDVPDGALQSNRVYSIDCENDEKAIRRLVVSYDEKLKNTQELLEEKIAAVKRRNLTGLSDRESSLLFCSDLSVSVTADTSSVNEKDLYSETKKYGLASDCPSPEEALWENEFSRSEKTLVKMLKQPRRSLSKAVLTMKSLNSMDTTDVKRLNAFQVEDIREHVAELETEMMQIRTPDLENADFYRDQMDEHDEAVRKVMKKRMNKKATTGIGLGCIAMVLVGCVPFLIQNFDDMEGSVFALVISGVFLALIAAAGLICLFGFRSKLIDKLESFNDLMRGFSNLITGCMTQYSRYLSCVCNIMRCNCVLNYYNENDDENTASTKIYKKHISDIVKCRSELMEVYGMYLTDRSYADEMLTEPFTYNYDRPVDYCYASLFSASDERKAEYIMPGYQITVPVDFVKRITVRMEELYE